MDYSTANEPFLILVDPFRTRLIEIDEWTRVNFNSKVAIIGNLGKQQ